MRVYLPSLLTHTSSSCFTNTVPYRRNNPLDCMRACSSPLLRLVLTTLADATAFFLSDGAFLPTIQSQATDEQREKWLPLIRDYRVIGAYAQTEMGHGNASLFCFLMYIGSFFCVEYNLYIRCVCSPFVIKLIFFFCKRYKCSRLGDHCYV